MLLVSFSYVVLKMPWNFQFAMNMMNLKNDNNLSHMFLVESTFYMPGKVHQHSVYVW